MELRSARSVVLRPFPRYLYHPIHLSIRPSCFSESDFILIDAPIKLILVLGTRYSRYKYRRPRAAMQERHHTRKLLRITPAMSSVFPTFMACRDVSVPCVDGNQPGGGSRCVRRRVYTSFGNRVHEDSRTEGSYRFSIVMEKRHSWPGSSSYLRDHACSCVYCLVEEVPSTVWRVVLNGYFL